MSELAENIINSKEIDRSSLEIVLTNRGYPNDKIHDGFNLFDKLFNKYFGSKIVDKINIGFNQSELGKIETQWESVGVNFFKNVGIIPIRYKK